MDAAALTADLCRVFEGLRLKPYLCPAGYPTIGFGIVNKPDGTQVKMTDPPITRETAEEWLIQTIKRDYMPGVLKASPILAAHPQRLAAMTDFAFNLGLARYRASTLRRRVDAEDWEGVKEELMKWTRGGGRVLPGLVKRRAAEAALMG
ncbi:MAG: hypothetical protein RL323_250 [Pseudomonadota bacterium]|jgi:lysozyme